MYLLLLIFIILHLLAYIIIFRKFYYFRQEKVILMYHVVFFLPLLLVGIFAWWIKVLEIPTLLGLISIEVIYNMTFLGIWSLIQGSYSMQILILVGAQHSISVSDIIKETESIGADKKQSRLQHLINMGLAEKVSLTEVKLTATGKCINSFFWGIKRLARIKTAG